MERYRKKDILNLAATMMKANDSMLKTAHQDSQKLTEILIQCQDAALQIGTSLESFGEEYVPIVELLESYCENLYQMSIHLSDETMCRKLSKKIRKQLTDFQNRIQHGMPDDRKEVVFLPYKASMWDSLESVWKAADADENTDAYVIPIPYYDRNPGGDFGEEHYEGDLYPEYVPITHYNEYDFQGRRPDAIYIHNPYDGTNYITSVHPFFYSKNLKKFTDKLIYIPYFVLSEVKSNDKNAVDGIKHFFVCPGVFHADKVIVQSEEMRKAYINVLTEEINTEGNPENERKIRKYWEKKIDGSGSPKFDKICDSRNTGLEIPDEWKQIIQNPSGDSRPIVLYNTGVCALLAHGEMMIDKMKQVFQFFKEGKDEAVLLWRPHPLIEVTIRSMRPQLLEKYHRLVEWYKLEKIGIYDDSEELDRAIALSDIYYGDSSSLVQLCKEVNMPVMIQEVQSKG